MTNNQNIYSIRLKNALNIELGKVFDNNGKMKVEKAHFIEACPVCKSRECNVEFVKDNFIHKKCSICEFIFIDPRLNEKASFDFYNSQVNEIYNETKFHEENYSISFDDTFNLNNYELIKEIILETKGKNFLEIGPGRGAVIKQANLDKFNVYAVELNKLLIEKIKPYCTKLFDEDIINIDFEGVLFDVIYFRDVMEHIPEPIPFLNKISSLLKPGGVLLIDTHNINSFINLITREYHTVIFGFEHPVHWSEKTLVKAGESVGLKHLKSEFTEIDFSIYNVLNYILNPSFTFINPPKNKRNIFLKFLLLLFKLPIIRKIDYHLSKFISLKMRRGSKMQVFFTK